MKNLTIIIALLVLFVNFLAKCIFPSYDGFNMCLNSVTIIIHTILITLLGYIKLKDAFRISLSFIFSTISLAMFVWGFFVSTQIENNISLFAMVFVVVFEIMALVIANTITKKVK